MYIGMYVRINAGKVNIYKIFLCRGACILSHWPIVVNAPIKKNVRYAEDAAFSISIPSRAIPSPLISRPKNASIQTIPLTSVSTAAAVTLIVRSKLEKS